MATPTGAARATIDRSSGRARIAKNTIGNGATADGRRRMVVGRHMGEPGRELGDRNDEREVEQQLQWCCGSIGLVDRPGTHHATPSSGTHDQWLFAATQAS